MRVNILSIMGFIMLAALLILGFFGFPIGFFICALLGLSYGITKKINHLSNGLPSSSYSIFCLSYFFGSVYNTCNFPPHPTSISSPISRFHKHRFISTQPFSLKETPSASKSIFCSFHEGTNRPQLFTTR